jgi:hypothetical protein
MVGYRPGPDFHIAPENLKMEQILLFVVDDAFQITGRGCILVPGPSVEAGAQTVRIGDAIRLRKSDGECVDTVVEGLEMLGWRRPKPLVITAPILLPRTFAKTDVPKGTEVSLVLQA